jgi:uridine nucleosidase
MKKVWVDTDPGVDDTVAIAMLFESPEIEIAGISTIFGNATVDLTTKNAKIILEAVGKESIPLARGAYYPLHVRLDTSPFVHGENGFGNMPLPEPKMEESPLRAPQAIINMILAHPHEITLLPIGPLTNIAMACLLEPKIIDLVKEVVIMGGAVHCPGNITPAAEANFFHDPHAAQIVISAGWSITLAGLDVCGTSSMISNALLDKIIAADKPLSPYIGGALPFYQNFLSKFGVYDKADFPDTLAAAYLLEPEIFTIEKTPLFIETEGSCLGQSVPVPTGKWYENMKDKTHYKADETISLVNVMVKENSQQYFNLVEKLLT